jgi:alpha-galactosidase
MMHRLTAALFMAMVAEYDQNMANLIKDVRKELNAPNLAFVIVDTGQLGPETKGDLGALCEIQMGMGDPKKHPEFMGIVASVETRGFARPAKESPSDFDYHWNHNRESHYLIGEAMGKAMLELLKSKSAGKGELR